MRKLILTRILSIALTLMAASIFIFLASSKAEGNSNDFIFSEDSNIEITEPDGNWLSRYLSFLYSFFSFDWGNDISGKDIKGTIRSRAPLTIELAIISIALSLAIAFPLSFYAAKRKGGIAEKLLSFISSISLSLPSFLIAIFLSLFFGFFLKLFPVAGYVPLKEGLWKNIRALFLPALTLALSHMAIFLRLFLASFRENLKSEYIVAAKGWGLNDKEIIAKEVLKPSISVIASVVMQGLAAGIAGSAIVESVFALPGLGSLMLSAALKRDVRLLGYMLLALSFFVSCIYIISEIAGYLSDPRERLYA